MGFDASELGRLLAIADGDSASDETEDEVPEPVALVERAIRNSSKSRDILLDPFGGSGSTLIACEKAGRQARLIELDPKYVDTIILRWQEWTGASAVLESDGKKFGTLAGQGRRGA
jgi:DNA modification methylase